MYLNLDTDGYLLSVSKTPTKDNVAIESLDDVDLSGVRLQAHRYNAETRTLTLDEDRLAELEQLKAAEDLAMEKAMHDAVVRKEVQAALLTAQINAVAVGDATALRWRDLYPEWTAGAECAVGFKAQRGGRLWRCLQAHTSQSGWEPESVPSLWESIDEAHAGTLDDPIPYAGNMALVSGQYYIQDGVDYYCTRDTVNPVYHALSELVGLYVEEV